MTTEVTTGQHDRWCDAEEVAEIIGYSMKQLSRWRRSGGGPPFARFGKGRNSQARYRRSDLDAWFEERMRSSASGAEK